MEDAIEQKIGNKWLSVPTINTITRLLYHMVARRNIAIMVVLKSTCRINYLCLTLVIILILAGCSSPLDRKPQLSDLDNPNSMIKIMAIKWAGDNKLSSAVPQLVDLLQDEDRSVRLYSIYSLRRITGTDCGYDYKAAVHVRAVAIKCWRQFLRTDQSYDQKESQNVKD
ncbi:MAG: HEAT repeat domain-containing protein [Planctomycetota bacterium]|jgi:hypothetical protein